MTEQCKTCGTWNIKGHKCPECEEKKRIEEKIEKFKKQKKDGVK